MKTNLKKVTKQYGKDKELHEDNNNTLFAYNWKN
jgi:hypothetical protein